MSVDFITFCCERDAHRLYHENWLSDMIASHKYYFDSIKIVHQNLGDFIGSGQHEIIRSEDHPNIFAEFNYPAEDKKADEMTHGKDAPHFWRHHNLNHLIGLKVSTAKYIIFSDSDCTILSHDPDQNWIKRGIDILERYEQVLIVSPGDGATMAEAQTAEGFRLTQNVSQQLFLCERERLANIDFAIPWDWEFLAPGEPFQEFYYLLEGRIWRYLYYNKLWRCVLPDYIGRYWHHNRLTDDGYFEADTSKY